jgi:hypothetical protein
MQVKICAVEVLFSWFERRIDLRQKKQEEGEIYDYY